MPLSFGEFHWAKFLRYNAHNDIAEFVQFLLSLEWTDCKMLEEKEENNAT